MSSWPRDRGHENSRLIQQKVIQVGGCYLKNNMNLFFFQAEDGIRDLTVTGVQTCALPICAGRAAGEDLVGALCDALRRAAQLPEVLAGEVGCDCSSAAHREWSLMYFKLAGLRSEERRVGKECRSRW